MWSTFIYGNPRGFYVYENVDESFRAYFRKLYDSSGEGRYMSIDRFPNGLTIYNYYRYGLHENGDRGTNCVFGMSIAFQNNQYYKDFNGLLKKLDALFVELQKEGVLFSLENGIVRYRVLTFDDKSKYVDKLKSTISSLIEENNLDSYDDTFASANPDSICTTLSDKLDNSTILNRLRQYSRIALTTAFVKTVTPKEEHQNIPNKPTTVEHSTKSEQATSKKQSISVESFDLFYEVLKPVINAGLGNAYESLLNNIKAVIGKETDEHIREKYFDLKFRAEKELAKHKNVVSEKEQGENLQTESGEKEDNRNDIGNFIMPLVVIVLVIIMLFCLKDCGCSCFDEDGNNETHDVEHVENVPAEQHSPRTIPTHTIVTDMDDKSMDNETERDVAAIVEKNVNTEVKEKKTETDDAQGQTNVDNFDENYIREEVLTNLNVGRESFVNDYFKSRQVDNQTLIKWQSIAAICDIINKPDTDSETKQTLIKSCQKSRNVSVDDIKTELLDNEEFKNAHSQTDGFNGILNCLQEIIVFKNVK